MKGQYDRKRKIEWNDLKKLYEEERLSSIQIAKIKQCAKSTVLIEMENQNIKSRKGREMFSEEYLKDLSKLRTGINNPFYGKTHSEKQKLQWKNFRRGKNHPNFGKTMPFEIKQKIRETLIEKGISVGENNPNFQNWKSKEPYTIDWTEEFKELIRKRDNRVCMLCNKPEEELNEKLHVHHIDYCKKNVFPQNCISLCRRCHLLTNYNRNPWKIHFRTILNELYGYKYSEVENVIQII